APDFLGRIYFNSGGPVFESGSGRPLFFRIFLVYYWYIRAHPWILDLIKYIKYTGWNI
ncbi:uncharacterized protein CLUP02_12081, partial [Colletotrichum lupini]